MPLPVGFPSFCQRNAPYSKKIGADEALHHGLLNAVVEDCKLEQKAVRMTKEILKSTRAGVEAVKKIINSIQNYDITGSFELSNALRQKMESSRAYIEGIDRHFMEKTGNSV